MCVCVCVKSQRSNSDRTHTRRGSSEVWSPWETAAYCSVLRPAAVHSPRHASRSHKKSKSETSAKWAPDMTYYRYWEDNIMQYNVILGCFCCRALLTWSTPGPVMFSASCGNILKRTWVCWGRRWIRTRTTRLLLFIWSSTPALSLLEVKLTFQHSSSNTCSLSLNCSEVAPARGLVWIGAGFDSHLITW